MGCWGWDWAQSGSSFDHGLELHTDTISRSSVSDEVQCEMKNMRDRGNCG